MNELLSARVEEFLRRNDLVGERLVVAVSGGPDSVCLLHVLAGLKEKLSLLLHVAHVDHGLRGDSAVDAAYVAHLAEGLGLPVTVERVDVQSYRRERALGLEEAAREVRYGFLASLAGDLDTPYIVTGHTASDHVETILLHLIRGAGLEGLVGLRPLTPWTQGERRIVLVRPLLTTKRTETEEYCHQMRLKSCLDETNLSPAPLRNRIRLELLPYLRGYNPGIDEALVRLASSVDTDLSYLKTETAKAWETVVKEADGAMALDKAAFLALPVAIQRHLLRSVLGWVQGGLKDIEKHHIENIMLNIGLPAGRHLDLPRGIAFTVDYNCYWLGRRDNLPSPYPAICGEYPLAIPGITHMPGWEVEARIEQERTLQDDGELVAYFDLELVGQGLAVRPWHPGDRFVPLGQGHDKKIRAFMIAQKVPRHWRRHVPLVVSPQQIAWLVGQRLDDRAKVTASTRRILRLQFKRV